MTFLSKLFPSRTGNQDGRGTKISAKASTSPDGVVILSHLDGKDRDDYEWDTVSREEGEELALHHGPAIITQDDPVHREWLAKMEYTTNGVHLVVELGRNRLFYRIPLNNVPRGSKVLAEVAALPPGTRNIWLRDMDYDELLLYLVQARKPEPKEIVAFKNNWKWVIRLGFAAERLADPIVLAVAISSLRHKAAELQHDVTRMFDSEDLEFAYSKLNSSSYIRHALAEIAIGSPDVVRSLTAPPMPFLEDLRAQLLKIEAQKAHPLRLKEVKARIHQLTVPIHLEQVSAPTGTAPVPKTISITKSLQSPDTANGESTVPQTLETKLASLKLMTTDHSLTSADSGQPPLSLKPSNRPPLNVKPDSVVPHESIEQSPPKQSLPLKRRRSRQTAAPVSTEPNTPARTPSVRRQNSSTLPRQPSTPWKNSVLRGQASQKDFTVHRDGLKIATTLRRFNSESQFQEHPSRQPQIGPSVEELKKMPSMNFVRPSPNVVEG